MSQERFLTQPPALESHQVALSHCASCPKLCRHTCPVADTEKRESSTPWALMSAIFMETMGQPALQGSDGALAYHCTGCRACQGACKFDNDVPGTIHAQRARVYARGDAPKKASSLVTRFHARGGNLHRPDLHEIIRDRVPREQHKPMARELVLIDCMTAAHYPEVIEDIALVLQCLGMKEVGFLIDADISCCGQPLYDAGDLEAFTRHALQVRKVLGGRRRLLCTSPGCAHILRDIYPTLGITWDSQVGTLLEAVAPLFEALPSGSDGPAVVYHHPCHLSRSLGSTERPRNLLRHATGRLPREAFKSGQETRCSGGGGGVPAILPQTAANMAHQCVQQLAPRSGEIVVTACPSSRHQLQKATTAPVMDLITILANTLKESTPNE